MTQATVHPGRNGTREIPLDGVVLRGDLEVPRGAMGLVLFAHGSGSSRFSPRNRAVAAELRRARLATLLLDLLTGEEERVDALTSHLRFDIPLLATRLVLATQWAQQQPETRFLPAGYFGASTGAAAALVAAAALRDVVHAVVSRGGRPDLAGRVLANVDAPTLLIVGGMDAPVIDLNRAALRVLRGAGELTIVPGATHLFEEPGALEEVARLAGAWFGLHLVAAGVAARRATSGW
jgi:pimeloyl-ACP methyl ester carboxylesterase